MGVFPIRISDETRVRWQGRADAAGLPLGAWVRLMCDKGSAEAGVTAPPVIPSGAQAVGSGRVSSAERSPKPKADQVTTDFKRGNK